MSTYKFSTTSTTDDTLPILILLICAWIALVITIKNTNEIRRLAKHHNKLINILIYLITPIAICLMHSFQGTLFVITSLIAWILSIQVYEYMQTIETFKSKIETLKSENTTLNEKNETLNKSLNNIQNKYLSLQKDNDTLKQRNRSLSGYLMSPGQHSIKRNENSNTNEKCDDEKHNTQHDLFEYSWYYIPRGKGYKPKEFEPVLVKQLESLKIGHNFYHSYGMLQRYKYTKLSTAMVAEKNTITQASTSVFRRKKRILFWQWKDDNNCWNCYNKQISNKIQKAKINEIITFKINNNIDYVVIKTSIG
eukprot:196472_1